MNEIRIKKQKFEEAIKTIFYEYLLKHIPKERNTLEIYDKIRNLVENNDNIVGCTDYQSINVTYKEGNVAVGTPALKDIAIGSVSLRGSRGAQYDYNGIGYRYYDIFQPNDRNFRYNTNPIYSFTGDKYYKLNISFLPNDFKVEISYDTLYVFFYYLNFHSSSTLINIQKYLKMYSGYKSTYTPIGATIISKANLNIKQKMIKDLLKAGWKPTVNDIDLLYLTIYQAHVDKIALLKYIYIDDIYCQLLYHMIKYTYHDYL
jgi:hypothetical protein